MPNQIVYSPLPPVPHFTAMPSSPTSFVSTSIVEKHNDANSPAEVSAPRTQALQREENLITVSSHTKAYAFADRESEELSLEDEDYNGDEDEDENDNGEDVPDAGVIDDVGSVEAEERRGHPDFEARNGMYGALAISDDHVLPRMVIEKRRRLDLVTQHYLDDHDDDNRSGKRKGKHKEENPP